VSNSFQPANNFVIPAKRSADREIQPRTRRWVPDSLAKLDFGDDGWAGNAKVGFPLTALTRSRE
jgi:hypothetical protein